MSKKQFIQQIIDTFEQHAGQVPNQLDSKFKAIKERLHSSTDEEIEADTISAVTSSPEERPYEADKLSYLLYEAFPEMEKIAKQSVENQYELLQATNELRGELGMATDPPSPE